MHILIDARFLGTGTGIATYTENLIKNLARIDQENYYSIVLQVKYFNHFKFFGSNFKKVKITASYYSLAEQIYFLNLLKKLKPDLVHFTNFNHPLFYKGKCVFTIHDLILSLFPPKVNPIKKLAYKIIINSAIKKADKIITPSKNTKKDIQKLFKVKDDEIEVIYEGINEDLKFKKIDPKELFKRYKIKNNYLLYVGRFAPHKNLFRLIKAFNILKKNYQINLQLVLVGPKDKEYNELKSLVKRYDLEQEIIFTGTVNNKDLGSLYQKAKAFVFPSLYEGFGLPILEAMTYQVPVVCSFSSSLPEVAGEASLYFNPYNEKEMADKIYQLINNPELRKNLIIKGKEQIKNFSWLKTAKETLKVYQSIVK